MERYILANGQAIYANPNNIWREPPPPTGFDSGSLWEDVQRYLAHLGISAIIMLVILIIQLVKIHFETFENAFDWLRNGQHRQWLRPIRPGGVDNVADAAPPASDIVQGLNRGPQQLGDGTPEAVLWKKERLRRQRYETSIDNDFVE